MMWGRRRGRRAETRNHYARCYLAKCHWRLVTTGPRSLPAEKTQQKKSFICLFIWFNVAFKHLMWNFTMEYTATHFNVLGKTRRGNPSPTFHTHTSERSTSSVMVVVSRKLGRKYRTHRVLNTGPVVCESITLSTDPQLLPKKIIK